MIPAFSTMRITLRSSARVRCTTPRGTTNPCLAAISTGVRPLAVPFDDHSVYNLHMITRTLFAVMALAAAASAQSKLQLKVHTGSGVNGYDVNSTMISGEKDMLVIDPQF